VILVVLKLTFSRLYCLPTSDCKNIIGLVESDDERRSLSYELRYVVADCMENVVDFNIVDILGRKGNLLRVKELKI